MRVCAYVLMCLCAYVLMCGFFYFKLTHTHCCVPSSLRFFSLQRLVLRLLGLPSGQTTGGRQDEEKGKTCVQALFS
jgi:hypothetical protein